MDRKYFWNILLVGILAIFCLNLIIFADGGRDADLGNESYIYDPVGIAEKIDGKVIMRGGYRPEPIILKERTLIEDGANIETKNNANLIIKLGPEIALGEDYRSTLELASNTEIRCHIKIPYYDNTDIWWKDDSYWIDDEIIYNFDVYSGNLKSYFSSDVFEYFKEIKYKFLTYEIIPIPSESGNTEFEINIIKEAKYGEDFEMFDIHSFKVIKDTQLNQFGVKSVEELSEAQKEEYDFIMGTYETVLKYQKFDALVLTVKCGKVKVAFNSLSAGLIELEAGQSIILADTPND